MTKRRGVDIGVLIYLGFINTLFESIKNPENKRFVLEKVSELKRPIEKKIGIKINQTTPDGVLEINETVYSNARESFYRLLLDTVESLEEKHGIQKTWSKVQTAVYPVYAQHHQDIIELGLEVPLGKFELNFIVKGSLNKSWIFKTFFGVIMGEEWSKGVILVTNKRLVIRSGSYSSEISMKDVLTVGREVYSDVKLKYSSRSINMIDFKTVLGVSAVIYDGPQEVISEFDKIVSRARVEARGLTLLEKSILVLLDRKQPIATILARGNIDKRTLDLALARLKDIGYVTEDGNLTSYGINALPERTYDYST